MSEYYALINTIICVLIVFIVGFLLRIIVKERKNNYKLNTHDALLTTEELEGHAKKIAIEHSVTLKSKPSARVLQRLNYNYNFILSVYKELNKDVRKKHPVSASAEWLLDNFYIIEEQYKVLKNNLNKKVFSSLPILKTGSMKGNARTFAFAYDLISHANGKIDEKTLNDFLKAYQAHNVLYDREIWILPTIIMLVLIENIRRLCEKIKISMQQWDIADELFDTWYANDTENSQKALKLFRSRLKEIDFNNSSFVEHLFYHLRRSGRSYSGVLRVMDEQLAKLGTTTEHLTQIEHDFQSAITVSMSNSITSIHLFGGIDWGELFESISYVEQILKEDPHGTYSHMDQQSRRLYRKRVERLSLIYGASELHVAKEAINLAGEALSNLKDSEEEEDQRNKGHVGYYLLGKGLKSLEERLTPSGKIKNILNNGHRAWSYTGSVFLLTVILTAMTLCFSLFSITENNVFIARDIMCSLLIAFPVWGVALGIINLFIIRAKKRSFLPKLELKEGIPESLASIVVLPAFSSEENKIQDIQRKIEALYLSNRYDNLYFAIISDSEIAQNKTISEGIRKLNEKYSENDKDIFYIFSYESLYNECKLICLSCEKPVMPDIRYIIEVDENTLLPMGMVKKMIGTMAHPLNKAVIDEKGGKVVEGYGIIQAGIYIENESSEASLFSRVHSSKGGIDEYDNSRTDVYQYLFGESVYKGKGIYDIKALQKLKESKVRTKSNVLKFIARTGYTEDINFIQTFPDNYIQLSDKQYRQLKDERQLLSALSAPPLSNSAKQLLSRIVSDNLIKSLSAPLLLLVMLLSFGLVPVNAYYWSVIPILILAFPFFINKFIPERRRRLKRNRVSFSEFFKELKAFLLQTFFALTFLPHNAFQSVYSLFSPVKNSILKEYNNLSTGAYFNKMKASFIIPPIGILLSVYFNPETLVISIPLGVLWFLSPFIARKISTPFKEKPIDISQSDIYELRKAARLTFGYFEKFVNSKNNYLAPDNYQEDPARGVANRTSPTNIGLGLLAILSGRDLGYITNLSMIDILEKTISTIEGLTKWNGHLYNWYDTRTLKPLRPRYISTVDSGNLLGYLITLSQGLKGYLNSPIISRSYTEGLRDTLYCIGEEGIEFFNNNELIKALSSNEKMNLVIWNRFLNVASKGNLFGNIKDSVWKEKCEKTVQMQKNEVDTLMPWLNLVTNVPGVLLKNDTNPELAYLTDEFLGIISKQSDLSKMPEIYKEALKILQKLTEAYKDCKKDENDDVLSWLNDLENTLRDSIAKTEELCDRYERLIKRVDTLSEDMQFRALYVPRKKLFSIGYDIEKRKLTHSYYDLLASEARQTSYICIAKGQIPPSHWFRMGRALTSAGGRKGLVSWTGTMFEYLMPLLIMKNYKNTLLDDSYSFAVKCQMKYGRQRNMPWGCSECAIASLDNNKDYQYKAIGIPWLGLKRGLIEDAVCAPYATFLALPVSPKKAVKNIKYLIEEGLVGHYGFYEAADYTPERLLFETRRTVVKTYMAHHQGMSLVALNNFLNNNIMQQRFHSDPEINCARILLQEKTPPNAVIVKENKEKVIPYREEVLKEKGAVRKFKNPDPDLPKAHILSNGNYSVMLTDRGTGFSKNKMMAVTRWREDSTLDPYGMFFYLRNTETDHVWSATYSPLNVMPDKYEVTFASDKAVYKRIDGQIQTETKVVVTTGDNAEIRRISIKNFSDKAVTIELTSYFEIVLASLISDIAHPAFGNLFVKTGYMGDKKILVGNRRPRSENDKSPWIAHAVVPECQILGDIQYETDRMQILGRGNTPKNPYVIMKNKPLSESVGNVLDPVMSLRIRVRIEPERTARVSFVTAVGESSEGVVALCEKYNSPYAIEGAFRLALARSQVEFKYLNSDASEIEVYQNLMSHILFVSPARRKFEDIIRSNREGQSSLWKHSISGDRAIVLSVLKNKNQLDILHEALKAHEYWRTMDLKVDLVILTDEEYSYSLTLNSLVNEIVLARQTHDVLNRPSGVFILDKNKLSDSDISLLYAAARLILTNDGASVNEQVEVSENVSLPAPMKFVNNPQTYSAPPIKEEEELLFFNGLGGFKENGKEYVIRLNKDQQTPVPWTNIIANPEFGFMVTESGSGYTWYKNSRENKLTYWSNDAVSDTPGEILYINDNESGSKWTVTPLPIREEQPYTITHGLGYSKFRHTSHGIEQTLTQFAHADLSLKQSILELKNISDRQRNLRLTYYIRPILGVTDQYTAMHINTELDETGVLMMRNHYNEIFNNQICYMDCSEEDRSVTGDRKEFFGSGDASSPECLSREKLSGRVGISYDPCGALQVNITLMPGEQKDVIFMLGCALDIDEIRNITKKYRQKEETYNALNKAINHWEEKVGAVQVKTPVPSMDMLLNGWLIYQTISCRLWARSGFYQSGGAYGFRDQLQDCLAIAHICPGIVRDQILRHARHQYVEGDVQHWWHEPEEKGIRTLCSDDLLWLPYVTAEYIQVTGDYDILNEELSFLEDNVLEEGEGERYGKSNVSSVISPLYDHCIRAIEYSLKFGSHGLPLIGTGDWNDGMNMVGHMGEGESVWLGWFLISVLKMFIPLCRLKNDTEKIEKYSDLIEKIAESIENNAWDGSWYRRAYFDNGEPIGSAQNTDCKIDSIAQSWSVISGQGDVKRVDAAMNSLYDYLVMWDIGIIKLLTPPFDSGESEPGYIKGYVPGVRENGGQYTHAAAWAIIAYALLGRGNTAQELFELINPINHSDNTRECMLYKVEPYVMAADVYSMHPHTGRGGWSWYTGSAGWFYKAGLEYILGFKKKGDSIVLDPCIPDYWREFSIKYTFAGSVYNITVKNPDGLNKGVKEIKIDGKVISGNSFKLIEDKKEHDVEVIMSN